MTYEGLAGRLADIRERIFQSQRAQGFNHPVRVVAVTKGHGVEAIRAALGVGLTDIGENRVQEAIGKQDVVTDGSVAWHLIGSLQRNKVRQVVGRFAWIHAIDRAELVDELARRLAQAPMRQRVLVEVNCSGEGAKAGVAPEHAAALVDRVLSVPTLEYRGLMTMAALTDDRRAQRETFGRLRALKAALEGRGIASPELSMGMSGDFEAAVEEGATMVRLGTILFGERGP